MADVLTLAALVLALAAALWFFWSLARVAARADDHAYLIALLATPCRVCGHAAVVHMPPGREPPTAERIPRPVACGLDTCSCGQFLGGR